MTAGEIKNKAKAAFAFLRETPVYFGRSLFTVPPGSVVFFPVSSNTLACGICGLVACAPLQDAPEVLALAHELEEHLAAMEKSTLDLCLESRAGVAESYLGGEAANSFLACAQKLNSESCFVEIFQNSGNIVDKLKKISARIDKLVKSEDEGLKFHAATLGSMQTQVAASRLEAVKDGAWCLKKDILDGLARIDFLMEADGAKATETAIRVFRRIDRVLSGINRLEVRGRDSAGISLLLFFDPRHFGAWGQGRGGDILARALKERAPGETLPNRAVSVSRSARWVMVSLVYKKAAEIGRLGDNVAFLRRQIREDYLFQALAGIPQSFFTLCAHTRWASVGAITEPNCHPVDNATANGMAGNSGLILVCLNGDIDNYAQLKKEFESRTGKRLPESVTTDTKIIPLQMEKYLQQGYSVEDAFRLAASDFTGSHAILMHTELAPGKLFLAQRGSGQALFVGLGEDCFMPASEVYGLVELTNRFVRINGEQVVSGKTGRTQGQIFVLDAAKPGLEGISACYYDGTPVLPDSNHQQFTPITARDIDRGDFSHYFLKEISQAPISVEKTLLNRWKFTGSGNDRRVVVDLDESCVPKRLCDALADGRIKKIHFIGQGTAGIAAHACADVLRHYLGNRIPLIAACKASEFSGFMLEAGQGQNPLSDTLVVAVTQSGTTTDTNRTVDMARACGAYTLAIVNRRDSDITFKVDGVIYTSTGRDIEMSVASTKAFYMQIVAGALLGLFFSRLTGARTDAFVADEIKQLVDLPSAMSQVLADSAKIEACAKAFALSRTYWAVVGSGPNKAAADEIRIKLSELCYKTISSDYVEDKKHIDLSSEPLILVCAAGSPQVVMGDIVKDTAIFKAHKAVPIVIADQGESRFDGVASDVLFVPPVSPHLAPILCTLVGHLWGFHAALAINEQSGFLFDFRENLRHTVESFNKDGRDVYELLIDSEFRENIARFYLEFSRRKRKNLFPSNLCGNVAADLTLLLKYMAGRLPAEDFALDFGLKGTPLNMLNTLFATLGEGINTLARPVDAIKHQAKTVTVGTSRIAQTAEGILFDAVASAGFGPDQLKNSNVLVLKNIQPIVEAIAGTTLYGISGLSLLGEPTDESRITLIKKDGTAATLNSRTEKDNRLLGTKRIIVARKNVYIGKGRKDGRSLVVIPVISGAGPSPNRIEHLLLLEVSFKAQISTSAKVRALGGKFEHIKNLVNEASIPWQDSFLDIVPTDELFGRSAEKIAEAIVESVRE
jgi:glucosamine--fructose-6-phosphate aminotransferase (isomerizing)